MEEREARDASVPAEAIERGERERLEEQEWIDLDAKEQAHTVPCTIPCAVPCAIPCAVRCVVVLVGSKRVLNGCARMAKTQKL